MNLSDKQIAKVKAFVDSVNVGGDVGGAITVASLNPTISKITAARKALMREVRKLDKALAIYGLDLAFDDAQALIEKAKEKL
jgi:hypothetical protein